MIQVSRDVADQPVRRGARRVPHPARAHRAQASRARRASTPRSKPAHYTDEDYERIDAIYAQEQPRGAEKRYWEDVSVGDELAPMVKGPTTITEMIAFHAGGYGFVPYGLRSSRVGYKNRKRIAPFYVKNAQGMWDVAQRLHWDSEWAKAIGNPMAYDYGVQRQCWFYHHVVRLGRRRRLHRAPGGLDPQVQLHGRHAVPVGQGRRQARARAATSSSTSSCT